MAINLVDSVMENLKGPVLEQLGTWLREDVAITRTAAGTVVPAILAGVADKATETDGTALLGTLLDQVDDCWLDKLGTLFKGDGASQVVESGIGTLSALFGEAPLTVVIEGLAGATGLNADKTKLLLAFLTPVALGALKRLITRKGLSLGWLIGLFDKQKASIAGLLPRGWSDVVAAAATVAAALDESPEQEPEAQEAQEA